MKRIILSEHAAFRLKDRGTDEQEVHRAVREGAREAVSSGRFMCRLNLQFKSRWQGKYYEIKQVAPVIVETTDEIIVVTVYTFYF